MTDETKKNEAGEQPITPVENKAENDRRRFLNVPGHGYETARCACHAAILTPVAASVSRPFCSARI